MRVWHQLAPVELFPVDNGAAAKVGQRQFAVFNFGHQDWYAIQNECPHQHQMVLSRGLIGDRGGEPKVACPLHKNQFSLKDGRHLGGKADMQLEVYPVRIRDGHVEIELEAEA